MIVLSDFVAMAIDGLNDATSHDYFLIRGETGVCWDAASSKWVIDTTTWSSPACDVGGALLLSQPSPDRAHIHRGDVQRALRDLVAPEFYQAGEPDLGRILESPAYEFLRNFMNGWDGDGFQGGNDDVYSAGFYLAKQYHPLDIEILRGHKIER